MRNTCHCIQKENKAQEEEKEVCAPKMYFLLEIRSLMFIAYNCSAAKSLLGSETDESEHIDNADGVGSDEEDEEEGSGQRTPTATSVSKILDTTLLEQRLNASAAIN